MFRAYCLLLKYTQLNGQRTKEKTVEVARKLFFFSFDIELSVKKDYLVK